MESEARALAEDRLRELAALPFQELLRFEKERVEERVSGPSGRTYLVRTDAQWDLDHDPYEGALFVRVYVRGRGLRRWERYSGLHMRGPETDFVGDPLEKLDVSSAWYGTFACLGLIVFVVGLPVSAIYAIRKLLGG